MPFAERLSSHDHMLQKQPVQCLQVMIENRHVIARNHNGVGPSTHGKEGLNARAFLAAKGVKIPPSRESCRKERGGEPVMPAKRGVGGGRLHALADDRPLTRHLRHIRKNPPTRHSEGFWMWSWRNYFSKIVPHSNLMSRFLCPQRNSCVSPAYLCHDHCHKVGGLLNGSVEHRMSVRKYQH